MYLGGGEARRQKATRTVYIVPPCFSCIVRSILAPFSQNGICIRMSFKSNIPLDPSFDKDIRDLHLIYDYNATDEDGKPTKWRYETWFFSESRVAYAIHGGPMAGRSNYQTAMYQCIRPGELWQCNWLEETGSIVSLVYDIKLQKITTLLGFSKGHWENPEKAHGDKRNPENLSAGGDSRRLGPRLRGICLRSKPRFWRSLGAKAILCPLSRMQSPCDRNRRIQ